jgi:hypothetical protein
MLNTLCAKVNSVAPDGTVALPAMRESTFSAVQPVFPHNWSHDAHEGNVFIELTPHLFPLQASNQTRYTICLRKKL